MIESDTQRRVLIVDDAPENIALLVDALRDQYELSVALDGQTALQIATSDSRPDLILLDIVMPGIDGYEVCKKLKADAITADIPVIFVTARNEVEDEAKGLDLGAIDYIGKPISPPIVSARIRNHLELKKHRDREVIQRAELEALLAKLYTDLAEAADYVRFLLPKPIVDQSVAADWRFVPSTTLGGDALGYHWIDEHSFAIYLVDVCGHGVGAALHSTSVLHVLRSENLQHTDFRKPEQVLSGLNALFAMESHKGMYFTMWYGVYDREAGLLTYASAGHPPALLITPLDQGESKIQRLQTPNLFVGGLPDASFKSEAVAIEMACKLYVFSDGVFEITDDNGPRWGFEDLVDFMRDRATGCEGTIDDLWARVTQIAGSETIEDDFSVVEIMIS